MRRLGGEPDRQASVVADGATHAAGLERARGQPLADEPAGDDHLAALEQVVGRAGPAVADVGPGLGEQQHLARQGALRVDRDRQRVVLDENELRGVDPVGAGLGEDDGDDVAHEPDDLAGDERSPHPLVDARDLRRREAPELDVGRGEHPRSGDLEPPDTSMPTTRACGYGDRTNVAWSAPGALSLST